MVEQDEERRLFLDSQISLLPLGFSLLSWTSIHFFHLLVGLLLCCLFFWSCSFSFHRFVTVIPEGQIYLMGREEIIYGSRRHYPSRLILLMDSQR